MNLYEYIAAQSDPSRAFAYVERIREFCLTLQTFPERGVVRDHIRPGVRVVCFEKRVSIAFRISPHTVTILRVLYGGRDLKHNLKAK